MEVLSCVTELCAANPGRDPSLMPSLAEFRSIGRREVYSAVERAGGAHAIAAYVGLQCNGTPRKSSNWKTLGGGLNIRRKRDG